MKRILSTLAASGLVLTAAVATAPSAAAGDRTCRGTIGKVTVDDVKVPKGATCTLKGTRVKGNITVGSKAVLKGHNMRVDGNLQCKSNSPAPKGARNKVKGNKEDQCRRF